MRSILVPVDFSMTSKNAVDFAVDWSLRYNYDEIILLKVYYESVFEYISVTGPGYGFMDNHAWKDQRKESKRLVKQLQKEIREKAGKKVEVTTVLSDLPILKSIAKIVKGGEGPELIVLGSDNKMNAGGSFISSHIINIARTSPVKLLIVPDGKSFEEIKDILVPCDIHHISHLDKLERYKSILETEKARLSILNINTSDKNEIQLKMLEPQLHSLFENVPHHIFYSVDKDIINGILSFVAVHDTGLIVALPGKHSFLYYLANKSISEGIYKNSGQIVLILK